MLRVPYQPVPYGKYKELAPVRNDSRSRYDAIMESYGDPTNKAILDFGCAEGYFCFRWLEDGGRFAYGVENDPTRLQIAEEIIKERAFNMMIELKGPLQQHFDVALYLDLWGHHFSLPGLNYFKKSADVVFVSPSKTGKDMNPRLKEAAHATFDNVEFIGQFANDRAIYKCS